MRVVVSGDAAEYLIASGGEIWVWAARPRLCCAGAPALMRAATTPPDGVTGFAQLAAPATPAGITVYFRAFAGVCPDVLEIAIQGKRHPKVAAYWDGCLMAMVN
jgi:hypothetical protein